MSTITETDFPSTEVILMLTRFCLLQMQTLNSCAGKPDRSRPTLDELMDEKTITRNERYEIRQENNESDPGDSQGKVIKFGWFDGVFMRCLLNIWGVMLFLRLTWVVGQAGLVEGLAIITLSNVVTLITSISMSAVCTNGQIKAGGIYYMISRSLGPEFGGAIGLMFTLANSIAVSMYLIGFCESLMDMLVQLWPDFNGIVDSVDRINDIRLIGSVSLVIILALAIVGMDWVTRVQMGLLFLLLCAQVDFIIGTFLPPSDAALAKGFVGYNGTVLNANLWSEYTVDDKGKQNSFFTVFAVFFPAVTGIVAGANLSGDLKDPAVAIPKGTLLAILSTYISYVIYAVMVASCSLRYASGIEEEAHFGTELFNETLNVTRAFYDCQGRDCEYGISVSQQMMEVIAAWGPLIYAGCFAATLSSAIASLVGAPRVFQAVAKDKLFPFIESFAEGWGANNDPVRGYILVFIIALICILIGDLNMVSSLLSNFFVAAYALINYSVFHASVTNSPGWRPSFKYFNKWVSLIGTALCIIVMFLMDYTTALITFICIIALYLYVHITNPNVNWGSSSQSQSFISALKAVQALSRVEDHVKNFRPKLMVMSGVPDARPGLIDFANLITKRLSLMECANIVDQDLDWKGMEAIKMRGNLWFVHNRIKAFYAVTRNAALSDGARSAVELSGLGKLSPNMMLIGFCQKWRENPERLREYFGTLQSAFDLHLAVGVLRIQGGLDISKVFGTGSDSEKAKEAITRQRTVSESSSVDGDDDEDANALGRKGDKPRMKRLDSSSSGIITRLKNMNKEKKSLAEALSMPMTDKHGRIIEDEVIERIIQYRTKTQNEGTIDVYWLYDDGGLTLLLPHILSTRAKFAKCKLRVFFLADKMNDLDAETRNMAALLAKFRIEFQDVILISDVTEAPSAEMKEEFLQMILTGDDDGGQLVSDEHLLAFREKHNFHLRIAEIVRQNSSEAELVVMTLPLIKKKGSTPPAALYMAWLDLATRNMPPFLLVRGNQESVLTFYS